MLVPALVGVIDPVVAEAGDGEDDMLWEVPEAVTPGESYAWLAGESTVIRALRRHLVGECGWDRGQVAFMGYWRLGHAEG